MSRSPAARRHQALTLLPRWPQDWAPRREYLTHDLPARLQEPRAASRWASLRTEPGRVCTEVFADASAGFAAWHQHKRWAGERRTWQARNGYIATPDARRMRGTGAIRLGVLQPATAAERRRPLQLWVSRDQFWRHVLVMGPTGAGKTTTLIYGVLYYSAFTRCSVFTVDVKLPGELTRKFVRHWRRQGRDVVAFAPWTPNETLACEPVWAATRADVDLIVDGVISAGSGEKPGGSGGGAGSDGFFSGAQRSALTSYVLALRYLPRRYCNLPTLYRVTTGTVKAVGRMLKHIDESYPGERATVDAVRTLLLAPAAWLERRRPSAGGADEEAARAAGCTVDGQGVGRTPAIAAALGVVDRSGYELQSWLRRARAALWSGGDAAGAPDPRAAAASDARALAQVPAASWAVPSAAVDRAGDAATAWRAARMAGQAAGGATTGLAWTPDGRPDPVGPVWDAVWARAESEVHALWAARREAYEASVGELATTMDQPDTTRSNIVMTLQNALRPFQSDDLARAFSRSEFHPRDILARPTLFVIGAPQAKMGVGAKFTATLLTDMVYTAVYERSLDPNYDRATALDVQFVLDEAPQHVPETLPNRLATIRSYGGPNLLIAQDDNQGQTRFGPAWGTVLANTVHQCTLFGSEGDLAERTAKRCGDAPLLQQSTTRSKGQKGGQAGGDSVGESAARVPRITATDVGEMRFNGELFGELTAISTGKATPAFVFRLMPYWEDEDLCRDLHYDAARKTTEEDLAPFPRLPLVRMRPNDPAVVAAGGPRLVPERDAAGRPVEDLNATDWYRETVDYVAPPRTPIRYELAPPPKDLRPIGVPAITPADLLKMAGVSDESVGAAPGSGAPAPEGAARALDGDPGAPDAEAAAACGADPGRLDAWFETDAAVPVAPSLVPYVGWAPRWYGLRERVEEVARARAAVADGGGCRPIPLGGAAVPGGVLLPTYLAQGVTHALDYPTWLLHWLGNPKVAPADDPAALTAALGQALEAADPVTGGMGVPAPLATPWVQALAALGAGVSEEDADDAARDQAEARAGLATLLAAAAESAVSLLGGAYGPDAVAVAWAEARGVVADAAARAGAGAGPGAAGGAAGVLSALPDRPVDSAARRAVFATEWLVDHCAYARAAWCDVWGLYLRAAADGGASLAQALGALVYPMTAVERLTAEWCQGRRAGAALRRGDGQRLAALGALRRGPGAAEDQVAVWAVFGVPAARR